MGKNEVQNEEKKGFRNLIAEVNDLPLENLLNKAEDLLNDLEGNVASEQSDSQKINKLAANRHDNKKDKDKNGNENGSAMASILKLVIKLLKMIIASRPVVNSLYGTDNATNGSVSNVGVPSETTPRDNVMSKQDALKKTLAQFDPDEFKILFDHLVDVAVEDGELTPEETTELLNVGIQGGLGTEDDIRAIVGKKLILHKIQTT